MWKNLPLKGTIYASLILNFTAMGLIVVVSNFLPPVVPLLYGLPSGQGQLVPKLGLFIAPSAGLLITIINVVLAGLTKDLFFKKALLISGTFISILAVIATIKTIFLVGFF